MKRIHTHTHTEDKNLPISTAGHICIISLHFEVIEYNGDLFVWRCQEFVCTVRVCRRNGFICVSKMDCDGVAQMNSHFIPTTLPNSPDIYFEGNLGLLNSPFFRDVLLYVNAQDPSGAAVPGILYSVSNVYFACKKSKQILFCVQCAHTLKSWTVSAYLP